MDTPMPSGSVSAEQALSAFKPEILETAGYHSPPQTGIRAKLNQNESPFDLPKEVKAELAEEISQLEWMRYPDFETSALIIKAFLFIASISFFTCPAPSLLF